MEKITKNYNQARDRYTAIGVDTDMVIKVLENPN